MSSRDDILARIRANQPAPTALPQVPTFDVKDDQPLVERFKAALARMGGSVVESDEAPEAIVRRLHPKAKVVCHARDLDRRTAPARLDGVDVGVVRARFGVAETGSVWVTDNDFRVSALGFLSQHLVVLLDPASIVPNMHHAYRRREEFEVGYGVFMTGPSATADIEGVLIHGAQGIRSLCVVLRGEGT